MGATDNTAEYRPSRANNQQHARRQSSEKSAIRRLKQSLGRELEALINRAPKVEWLPADDSEGGLA